MLLLLLLLLLLLCCGRCRGWATGDGAPVPGQDLSTPTPALLSQAFLPRLVVLPKHNLCSVVVVVAATAVVRLETTKLRTDILVSVAAPLAAATEVRVALPRLEAAAVSPPLPLAPVPVLARRLPVTAPVPVTVPVTLPVALAVPAAAAAAAAVAASSALPTAAAAAPPCVALPLPVSATVVVVPPTPLPATPPRVSSPVSEGGWNRRRNLALLRLLCAGGHDDGAPGASERQAVGAQAFARAGAQRPRLKL